MPLKVPQVRGDVSFYPSALTKGPQTERALTLAVAEMYIQGVSTRKVEPIIEKLAGHGISSSSASKATAELDETLQAWRNRSLNASRRRTLFSMPVTKRPALTALYAM